MKLEVAVVAKIGEVKPWRVFAQASRSKNWHIAYQVVKTTRSFEITKKHWMNLAELTRGFRDQEGYEILEREAQLSSSVKIDLYDPWIYPMLGLNDFDAVQEMLAETASKSFVDDPDQWQARLYNFAKGQDMDACMSDLIGESLTFFAPVVTDITELIDDDIALSSVDQSHMTMPGFGAWA